MPAATVATTLALFVLVYGIVFSMGIYYINRLIAQRAGRPRGRAAGSGTPVRPLSPRIDAGRETLSPQR